jgi:hypothetical protein
MRRLVCRLVFFDFAGLLLSAGQRKAAIEAENPVIEVEQRS